MPGRPLALSTNPQERVQEQIRAIEEAAALGTGSSGGGGGGVEGPAGPEGKAGVSAGVFYKFQTSTGTAPGAGIVRLNNATQGSATAVYINYTDLESHGLEAYIKSLDESTSTVRGFLLIRSISEPSKYWLGKITGAATEEASWSSLPVTTIAASGTLANESQVTFEFYRVGDKGEKGSTGSEGGKGETGAAGTPEGVPFIFSTETSEGAGSGILKFNTITPETITTMYISKANANSVNVSAWLGAFDDSTTEPRGYIIVHDTQNTSKILILKVTGAATSPGEFWKVPVTYVAANSPLSVFENGHTVAVAFSRTGDKGEAGAKGETGAKGSAGEEGVSQGVLWTYSNNVEATAPGSGVFKFDSTTLASITKIRINETDALSGAQEAYLKTWAESSSTVRGYLKFGLLGFTSTWAIFKVEGARTDNGTWDELTVKLVSSSSGFAFSNSSNYWISFSRTGDQGAGGEAVFVNVKTEGAKGDGTTDDRSAIQAAINTAATAGGGVVFFPAGTYKLGGALELKEKVTLKGVGPASKLELNNTVNTDVIKSAGVGAGGADFTIIEDLWIDGNKANNATGGCGVNLDGRRTAGMRVWISNCKEEGLKVRRTATQLSNELGASDQIFWDIYAFNNEKNGIVTETNDVSFSQCRAAANKEAGFKTASGSSATVFNDCHAWGAAEYGFNFEGSFDCVNCQAEGASVGEVRCKSGGRWTGGRVFVAGTPTNVPGFLIVENASQVQAYGVNIKETGTGGAFKAMAASAGSGSVFDFLLEGGTSTAFTVEAGGSWSGNIEIRPILRGSTTIGTPPGPNSIASAEEITLTSNNKFFTITGTVEIKKIKATYAGHVVALKFSSTAKLVSGNNLKFETVTGAENKMVTLACDGTNWYHAT